MTANPIHQMIRKLTDHEQSDGQLLERFLRGDTSALDALIRRHAPMVLGVCRRTLGHDAADDAFQATFLVLLRRASSIWPREQLANWLYGVAYQTARKARQTNAKRNSREKQVIAMPEPLMEPPGKAYPPDLLKRLDEELSRLPEKYRVAVFLCELQGRTLRSVAEHLRVPEGTVGSRLARGKKMLAERLTRRGMGVSATSLAALWAEQAASGAAPHALLSHTIEASRLMAAGQTVTAGLLSSRTAPLTATVLRSLAATKQKAAGVVFLLAGLLIGGGTLAYHVLPDPPSNAEPLHADRNTDPPPPEPRKEDRDGEPDPGKFGEAAGASNFARTYAYDHFPFAKNSEIYSQWTTRPVKVDFDPKTNLWTLLGSYRFDSTFGGVRENGGRPRIFEEKKSWAWDWKLSLSYKPAARSYEVEKAEGFDSGEVERTIWRAEPMDDYARWIHGKFMKPEPNAEPLTALRLVVDAPDAKEYGLERNYSYGKDKLAVESIPRGVKVTIDIPDAVAGKVKQWTLQFGAAFGQSLKVADYGGACPPGDDLGIIVGPFLQVAGWLEPGKRGAWGPVSGEFVVREIELQDKKVVRLAIDFIADTHYGLPSTDKRNSRRVLYGSLRFNSRFHLSMPELDHDAAK